MTAAFGAADAHQKIDTCYSHVACILSNVPEHQMANFASSSVVLGLLPGLLASFGPSVAEISLLSSHRPVLALLLSLGAPAVFPTRVLEYDNPMEVLQSEPPRDKPKIPKLDTTFASVISLAEYLFALGAVVNMVDTSWALGVNTVLDWSCTTYIAPLIWTLIPVACHGLGAASLHVLKRTERHRQQQKSVAHAQSTQTRAFAKAGSTAVVRAAPVRKPVVMEHFLLALWQLLEAEAVICANRSAEDKAPCMHKKAPLVAVLLNVAAGIIGFVHIILGTVIFSSLLFVPVEDVMKQVLSRYLASTVVCKLILMVEIAGLRAGSERPVVVKVIQSAA